MQTPQPPQDPASPGQQPSSVEEQKRLRLAASVRSIVLFSMVGMAGTILATATPWGVWGMVVGAVALLVATVFSVRALVQARALRLRGAGRTLLVLVLLGTLYFTVNAAVNVSFWGVTEDYRDCLQHSVTQRSQDRCPEVLQDSVMRWMPGESGGK